MEKCQDGRDRWGTAACNLICIHGFVIILAREPQRVIPLLPLSFLGCHRIHMRPPKSHSTVTQAAAANDLELLYEIKPI